MNTSNHSIFLLRHEERGESPEFESLLTPNGILNRYHLINKLKNHNVDNIYVSPYIRCLQTIQPLSSSLKIKTCVDYRLSEWFNLNDSIHNYPSPRQLTRVEYLLYSVDQSYYNNHIINIPNNESPRQLAERITLFLSEIDLNKDILICSHLSVLNQICKCYGHERDLEDHFEMGSLIDLKTLKCL